MHLAHERRVAEPDEAGWPCTAREGEPARRLGREQRSACTRAQARPMRSHTGASASEAITSISAGAACAISCQKVASASDVPAPAARRVAHPRRIAQS